MLLRPTALLTTNQMWKHLSAIKVYSLHLPHTIGNDCLFLRLDLIGTCKELLCWIMLPLLRVSKPQTTKLIGNCANFQNRMLNPYPSRHGLYHLIKYFKLLRKGTE